MREVEGAIGGVVAKIRAATSSGAAIVALPADNYNQVADGLVYAGPTLLSNIQVIGIATLEENARLLALKGPRKVSPFFIPMFIPDIAAGLISIRHNAQGPNYATVSACASSAHAIGNAMRYIQRGDADVMIAGGSESTITPLTVAGFASMKAMTTRNDDPARASRPFDAGRDGFLIAEGAAQMESAPWLLIFPASFLAITLFCFNFIGDGLRDALDPKDR